MYLSSFKLAAAKVTNELWLQTVLHSKVWTVYLVLGKYDMFFYFTCDIAIF